MKEFLDIDGLKRYHNFVAKNLKKLSDEIDTRIQQKFDHIMGANTSDGEVLDARRGEKTLGKKIDKIDERIDGEVVRTDLLREQTNHLLKSDVDTNVRIDDLQEIFDGLKGESDTVVEGLNSIYARKHVDFANSKNGNGYQKLPNGIIIQWGRVEFDRTDYIDRHVDFPIQFPNCCLSVNATMVGNYTNHYFLAGWGCVVSGESNTGFQCYCRNIAGDSLPNQEARVDWIAIGY